MEKIFYIKITFFPVLAKVLQIKEDANNSEDKCYYIHYLDFEKRMDRWIDTKSIIKNHGANSKFKELNGVDYILFNFLI